MSHPLTTPLVFAGEQRQMDLALQPHPPQMSWKIHFLTPLPCRREAFFTKCYIPKCVVLVLHLQACCKSCFLFALSITLSLPLQKPLPGDLSYRSAHLCLNARSSSFQHPSAASRVSGSLTGNTSQPRGSGQTPAAQRTAQFSGG